jgi:hypothetical protein
MKPPNWTFSLRLLKRNPDGIPLEHLAEYLRLFSEILGAENEPVFKDIKAKSISIQARVSTGREIHARMRLVEAKNDPESRPGKSLAKIQECMTEDRITGAELADAFGTVLYSIASKMPSETSVEKIFQHGLVDGRVTGVRGVDSTMHLYLRDHFDRDLYLVVKNEALVIELLKFFRGGRVRLSVHGNWVRGEHGWSPVSIECVVESFEALDEAPPSSILTELAAIPGNGWHALEKPQEAWHELRGVDD